MDIKLFDFYNNSKRDGDNNIIKTNKDGKRVSHNSQVTNQWKANPAQPFATRGTKWAANTFGVRNLCDVTQMKKEIHKTRFNFDFAKIPELAQMAEEDKWFGPSLKSRKSQTSSNQFSISKNSSASFRGKGPSNRNQASGSDPLASLSALVPMLSNMNRNGFYFPLLQDSDSAKKILVGEPDVDLVTYTIPGLSANATTVARAPIIGPIFKRLGGTIGIDARLGFGLDTSGVNRWVQSGAQPENLHFLSDGFYVSDRWTYHAPLNRWFANPNGVDLPEFSVNGGLFAGVEGNLGVVNASVDGGVFADIGVDFLDNGELIGESDGKLRGDEIRQMTQRSINDVVALEGSLNVGLNAAVQLGIDLGFFTHWEDIWTQELVNLTLFEFSSVNRSEAGSASNEPLKDATIFFDANYNLYPDEDEPVTKSSMSSAYNFSINLDIFDKNGNGNIDPSEGRLVAYDGTETKSGLRQFVPFIASSGQFINPITTFARLIYENNPSKFVKEKHKISELLGVSTDSYFNSDPNEFLKNHHKKKILVEDINNNAKNLISHNVLHFAYDFISYALKKLMPNGFDNSLESKLEIMSSLSVEILDEYNSGKSNLFDTLLAAFSNYTDELILKASDEVQTETLVTINNFFSSLGSKFFSDLQRQFNNFIHQETVKVSTIESDLGLARFKTNAFLNRVSVTKAEYFMHYRSIIDEVSGLFDGQRKDGNFKSMSHYIDNNLSFKSVRIPDDVVIDDLSRSSAKLRLIGGIKENMLTGGLNADILIGGPSADQLNGGAGFDRLIGGGGPDQFFLASGKDRVVDFDPLDGDRVVSEAKDIDVISCGSSTCIRSEDGRLKLYNLPFESFDEDKFIRFI